MVLVLVSCDFYGNAGDACDTTIDPNNMNQYIVWAIGGLGETAFIHFNRADREFIIGCSIATTPTSGITIATTNLVVRYSMAKHLEGNCLLHITNKKKSC